MGMAMQMAGNSGSDEVSLGLADFFDALSAEDRASLVSILRDTNTYLAEDMNDVMAILDELNC
jgi:hypothetical protein